ncbi:hypothetical protein BV494_16545 [Rahnella sikkimica]|uniref:Uncharacterized protein n=1 Tax=Rahnella sikkimica TaxID=1805933 RepID=A0A2L1UXB6_9GAMM|nr:hypothetical protein BV494_16545 [Rahnella sikkimica]
MSSCRCVDCARSPQSLSYLSSRGFTSLSPSCHSNYFVYKPTFSRANPTCKSLIPRHFRA